MVEKLLNQFKHISSHKVPLSALLLTAIVVCFGSIFIEHRTDFHLAEASLTDSHLGVTKLIQELRTELEVMEVQRAATGQDAVFRIKNFDLELNFVVKTNSKNKNEIHYEVVTVGMDQELARERSDRIMLHMEMLPPQTMKIQPSTTPIPLDDVIELPPVPMKGVAK
jgi:hypothetical protein